MDLRSAKRMIFFIKIIKNVYLMNVIQKHFLIIDLIESLEINNFLNTKIIFIFNSSYLSCESYPQS